MNAKYSRAQGAIEYLLIIGAAILVVAVVIIAVSGLLTEGTDSVDENEINMVRDPLKGDLADSMDNYYIPTGRIEYFEYKGTQISLMDLKAKGDGVSVCLGANCNDATIVNNGNVVSITNGGGSGTIPKEDLVKQPLPDSEICDDSLDNDKDSRTDCADNDCENVSPCESGAELTCSDGFDNDADGLMDCQDSDCYLSWDCPFTKTDFGSEMDCLTPSVCITRGNDSYNGLYNFSVEGGWNGSGPSDTEWYFGSYCQNSIYYSFTNWSTAFDFYQNYGYSKVNTPGCLHLISSNQYYNVMFTQWGEYYNGGGQFTYVRTLATPLIPPVAGCTNPNATNYDPLAEYDNGSCVYPPMGTGDNYIAWTTDNYPSNYFDNANTWSDMYSCPEGEVVTNVNYNICVEGGYDYFYIYDGSQSNSLITDNSCNGNVSTGNLGVNNIRFLFTSDGSVTYSGIGGIIITCGTS